MGNVNSARKSSTVFTSNKMLDDLYSKSEKSSSSFAEKNVSITTQYELGPILSVSSEGELRMGINLENGKRYVMRVLKKIDFEEKEIRAHIIRNKLHLRLSHPNLVSIIDVFNDNKYLTTVYEWVEGGNLFDVIHQSQKYSEKEAANIIQQLLQVIGYLHSNNIVHRDIKPENIMYNAEICQIKLVSLSLCRVFEPGKMLTSCRGTPSYMAPETIAESYNEKVDVWACGIILYALITSRLPFNAINDEEILLSISSGKYELDAPEFSRFSPLAKELVQNLLTFDPAERPSALEAIQHPWFSAYLSDEFIPKPHVRRVKRFNQNWNIGKEIFKFFVREIVSANDKKAFEDIFARMEKDDPALLTKREFKEAVSAGETGLLTSDIERVLMRFHKLKKPMDIEEFLRAILYRKKLITEQNMKFCYKLLEEKKGKELTFKDLRELIFKDLSEQYWAEFLDYIKKEQDDLIPYSEFRHLLKEFIATFG